MQGDVVDLDVDGEARVLHRVAREVLHARHDVALQAAGQGGAELADVMRILAVGLLGPPPRRVAQHVDAHGAGQVGADRAQLATDGVTDALLEVRVPRRAPGHRHREAGRVPDHRASRSVAEPDARQADPLDLGRDERSLVVAVVRPQEGETGPRRRITVEAPQPLLARQRRDQRSRHVLHRLAGRHRRAGLLERIDDHR